MYGTAAQYRALASCLLGFGTCDIWGEFVSHSPNPQPGGPGLCFYTAGTRYNPRQWVFWYLGGATSSAHNNCKLLIGCC